MMNKSLFRYLIVLLAGIMIAMIGSPTVQATTLRNRATVEINEPIQVPGAVLSPGKYVFQLEASLENRNVVHIFKESDNGSEKEVAVVTAIPNEDLERQENSKITTYAVPKEGPKLLRAWFAPGERYGRLFVYSKDEALRIAKKTGENIPVTEQGKMKYEMTPEGNEVEMGHTTTAQSSTSKKEESSQSAANRPNNDNQ